MIVWHVHSDRRRQEDPLIAFRHNVDYESCPAAKRMPANPHTFLVIKLLPQEPSTMVLTQHGSQDVGSEGMVEFGAAGLLGAWQQAVMLESANSQKVNVYPNRPSACEDVGRGGKCVWRKG